MKRSNSEIAYTEDIFKEVVHNLKEEGVTFNLVRDVYHVMLSRLQHLTNYTDATAVIINGLGTMYLHMRTEKARYTQAKIDNASEERLATIKSRIDKVQKFTDTFPKTKTNRHLQPKLRESLYYTDGWTMREIEAKQNRLSEEG